MNLFKRNFPFCFLLSCFFSCSTTKLNTAEKAKVSEADGDEFSIAVIPDTQYYTAESRGGNISYFKAQTDWIMKNRAKEHIAYVIHVGDVVDNGEEYPKQWDNAWAAMSTLETPYAGHPYGIPYGVTVGNHDQTPSQFALTGKTENYNKYFGIKHFENRYYYGGHYGKDNDNHYDLFSACGMDFIAIYLEYDSYDENQDNLNNWACDVLDKYPGRKAIIVAHSLIGNNKVAGTNNEGPATFSKQGIRMYDRLKTRRNIFLMICGHVVSNGEGYRKDVYAGNTIQTFLSNYQARPHGGNGLMRLMTFSKKDDLIHVRTFSPSLGTEETDGDSRFVKPWTRQPTACRVYDFDNDGRSDIASFRDGNWYFPKKGTAIQFGTSGDIPVPADYFASGKAELALYSPATSTFHIQGKGDVQWGKPGDIPVPGDYDGDGVVDIAVYRPTNHTWYIKGQEALTYGANNAILVPGDYDGDGKTEPAFVRLKDFLWQVGGGVGNVPFGQKGDIPVPGDYNGDGKVDMALFRPSTGTWLVYNQKSISLGKAGDVPVPGDYFGDGRIHAAVYDPVAGTIQFDNGTTVPFDSTKGQPVNLPYPIKKIIL